MTVPNTSSESSSRSSMAVRMRRGPRYRPHLNGVSVELRLQARDGRAPSTWHREIYGDAGCFVRCRMVLEELLAIDDRGRARMLLGQLTAVLVPPSLDASRAVHRQDLADAQEDLSQANVVRTPDWIRTGSPAELEKWERDLREQADASTELADLIRRERQSRKGND